MKKNISLLAMIPSNYMQSERLALQDPQFAVSPLISS